MLNSRLKSLMAKQNAPDTGSYRELLERVAASRKFQKSARMRDLLHYLGKRSLEQPGCEIREQEIGVAVFGREPHYDTVADTIARVNVHDLRKKLDAYFSTDGRDEPILISIPKGSYCPEFVERPRGEEVPDGLAAAAPPRIGRRALTVLCIGLAATCAVLAVVTVQMGESARSKPVPLALRALWTRLFTEGRTTDLVLADSNLSLLQDLLRQPLPTSDYRAGNLARVAESILGKSSEYTVETLMSRRYTSMADVHIVSQLLRLDGLDSRQVRIHFARDFAPEDLKTSNVILSGSKRSNPWVRLFEDDLNFRFDHDETSGYAVVVNKRPQAGELERYLTSVGSPTLESYGVVAFLPNLGNTGNVLVIQGGGMNATEAGGDFVTHSELFEPFLRRIGWKPGQSLPYFEVLLETTVMGAAMLPPRVVCFRLGTPRAPGR